jgi:hypothetical protein
MKTQIEELRKVARSLANSVYGTMRAVYGNDLIIDCDFHIFERSDSAKTRYTHDVYFYLKRDPDAKYAAAIRLNPLDYEGTDDLVVRAVEQLEKKMFENQHLNSKLP